MVEHRRSAIDRWLFRVNKAVIFNSEKYDVPEVLFYATQTAKQFEMWFQSTI